MDRFKGLVDVVGGKMKLEQINHEIRYQLLHKKKLKQLIISVTRRADG